MGEPVNTHKSAAGWARTNALRERGIVPRGAPSARVAAIRQAEAARKRTRKGRRP
jgi:hypothetical protein